MARTLSRIALALTSLFLAATPLAAQDTGGRVAEEADRYAFHQDYEPAPALWKLSDEDTTIYMLGTIHALPEGFRWRSAQLNSIIAEVDGLVLETTDYAEYEGAIDLDAKFTHRVANRVPTSQRLSPEGAAQWRRLIERSGADFEAFDNLPVLSAMLSMGYGPVGSNPSSTEYGVETVLEGDFLETNRPIESIEDSGAVMYSLLRLDDDAIIADLDAKLLAWRGKSVEQFYDADYVDARGDDYWADEHRWARGEVQDHFDIGFGDGAIGRAFNAMLLDRRNTAWAQWLDERLDSPGTILLAVGSGHFEGDVSLLAKLRERGLTAERIN
ncbi:TraB/GumN family protein [Aurantiacibacter luteus]|uniref:Polysaccharide biosynthesis protein GumN n=1 Tax=Aurantiacibacter luteus TaxID=1581420 RepID=A0A0G9MXT6_9SPHN|nr:TraB/GumN family protein [Aurantiacibacter luteus]KLE35510.1 hypothetical protein AAW00_03535 [Aurantiacibacter luteus]